MTTPFCVQCHDRPAKWKELKCQENTYCGRLCQLQYHLVGGGIVSLEAYDGTRIRITFEQAHEMQTIELLLEGAGYTDSIPLHNMDGGTLKRIETFLLSGKTQENMTDQQFMDLLRAANYLNFERLYMYLMSEWINKRPFPGPNELKNLVPTALYFYNGYDFNKLNVDDVLKKRIQKFISADAYESKHWNIRMAAADGKLAVVKLLLKDGPNLSKRKNYAIQWAAANGQLEVVDFLLKNGADPTTQDDDAIRTAAENGHLKVVELLLRDGRANPANWNNYAVHMAAENGHLAVVRLLMQDERVHFDIVEAARYGYLKAVKMFLDDGADPTINNNDAIRWAAHWDHYAIVQLLLEDERVDPEVLADAENPNIRYLYLKYRHKKQRVKE